MQAQKKKPDTFDDSFYKLAGEVTRALEKNKADGTLQKEQVEELMDAERKFKQEILKRAKHSTEIYKKFLQKICIQNKNILSARPYFRESAITFSKKITPAIKAAFNVENPMPLRMANIEILKTFDINYQLVKFIKDNWRGPMSAKAEQLFERIHTARVKLIQNNMPLAINRAKLFYRKTPKSHISLMDMIGICGAGLIAGIDKYVGEYSPVFRSVCIGRMVGNLIDSYSETMLHFYPSDKRILYKAHTIRGRQGIDEMNELSNAVNDGFEQDEKDGKTIPKGKVTASQLSSLMSASSTVSAEITVNEDGHNVYEYTSDSSQDIEKNYIEKESTISLIKAAKHLPIINRKVLRLKGLDV